MWIKRRNTSNNIYGRGFADYMDLKDKPECDATSVIYSKSLFQLQRSYKKYSAMMYFLSKETKMKQFSTMLQSSVRTSRLLGAVMATLNDYGIPEDWKKDFMRETKQCANRANHIRRIIAENLKLTEYWCYFRDEGMKAMDDIILVEDMTEQLDAIKESAKAYNKTHQDEIQKHMEEVRPLIESLERMRLENKAKDKAELKARRIEKARQDSEVREIKKNNAEFAKVYRGTYNDQIKYIRKLEMEGHRVQADRETVQQGSRKD